MNPAQRSLKRNPRQPLRSPLPPLKESPRHWPWRLHCQRPALWKVSTLHERSYLQGVVVTAKSGKSSCLLLTGAEAEGSAIPEAVPVEALEPEAQGAARAAPELAEVASGEAPAMAGEDHADVLPESTLEVVLRSPEIQDAEPIRSAPMYGAATNSRGGVELLADDLVDPAAVTRHLEAMRQGEQWMKVSCRCP
jgi:hypothetical protein